MPNKTAIVNLGEGMIYKITVPDPETPTYIEIAWIPAEESEVTQSVNFGGMD